MNWDDNSIQFPRLIAEAEAAGLWLADVSTFNAMCESMDLEHEEVFEVIDRAKKEFAKIVEEIEDE
jgi:purine nucleoside phosphorylase